jgi:hypothetical protein
MNEYTIKKVNDLYKVIDQAYEEIGGHYQTLWWRGHSDKTWKLLPSVYRPKFKNHEIWLTQEFIRKAKTRYKDCPPENAWPEWLILMQHHGLPTRMLDWSESPLVAAFFAVLDNEDSDGTIWVLNPYDFNYYENNTERIVDCYEEIVLHMFGDAFWKGHSEDRIVAVQMPENHERMLVQHAAFTVHGKRTPIDEYDDPGYLSYIKIPAKLKPQLKIKLSQLGFTASTLFPDLDHLALDLKKRHSNKNLSES